MCALPSPLLSVDASMKKAPSVRGGLLPKAPGRENPPQSLGMQTVVVTLAERGCEIYSGEAVYKLPARKTQVVDVTGAGDTFCSSFISQLDEMGAEQAGRFANTAASLCVSKLGARSGAVRKEEVLKLL